MALTRIFEEHELPGELRGVFAEVRQSLDLPFVPTLFKILANRPAYLKAAWSDVRDSAASREFHSAAYGLEEFARSLVIHAGWRLSDQNKVLSRLKFTPESGEVVGALSGIFAAAVPRMALATRLLQMGFSGGQAGRVSSSKQPRALAQWFTVNIPPERAAGLRTWLLYSDIRRTMKTKNVLSLFRALSLYPGYLAAFWVDAKKILELRMFENSCEHLARRARALSMGLPVGDHRKLAKMVSAGEWKEIEVLVDSFAQLLPQMMLLSAIWRRSFEGYGRRALFAA